jgi:hypothetical protein
MSYFLKVVMLAAGLLVPGLAAAQDTGISRTGIPQSPPAKIEGKFAIAHVEDGDRTVIGLAHQKVGGEKSCAIWVTAGFTYTGKLTSPPERVHISFVRDSADEPTLLKSEADRLLVLSVDGETVRLGPMPSVKEVVTGYSLVTQGFLLPIPYETFSKIANAKRVGVKLGPLEFNLTDKNLQDFRDLQHRMKP